MFEIYLKGPWCSVSLLFFSLADVSLPPLDNVISVSPDDVT